MLALNTASLVQREGAEPIAGEALPEVVRRYNLANAIVMRLTGVIDRAALTAITKGVTLDLTTLENAGASAAALEAAINDPAVKVVVRSGELP